MNVIFVEPAFPAYQRQFVRGLRAVGATVIGIGERPVEWLDDELRGWMHHYHQVSSVTNVVEVRDAVRWIQNRVWVDRLEATIEAHIMPAAEVREDCGIPGTSRRTAWLCRDKPAMKEVLRAAGVPTAASAAVETVDQALGFAAETGYPLIIKPRAAAGAAGTSRVDNDTELRAALQAFGADGVASVALEEFVEGHEGFYDTLSINGTPAYDFVCHYYPNVLEAMRTRWISPQFVATNRIDEAEGYADLKELGARVNEVLGIGTSATHMEWFYGPRGLRFSEIGCRPPGVSAWDLYAAGNDTDIYLEWARAVVHGDVHTVLSRRYAAGLVALRPTADGHIHGYSGASQFLSRHNEWFIDSHLPVPGTPTQPVAAGFMANAYLRMKHPDYDVLRGMLNEAGETITVHAG